MISLPKSPWIKFLPFIFFYAVIAAWFSAPELIADEPRYLRYAQNLLDGLYTNSENPEFKNGPGFPLILAPIILVGAGKQLIVILNALYVYLTLVFLYKCLKFYTSDYRATWVVIFFGCFPVVLKGLTLVHTESVSVMFATLFLYHVLSTYHKKTDQGKHIFLATLFLGILILIKVLLAYVALFSLLFSLTYFLRGESERAVKLVMIFFGALLLCTPYILYTYSLTGKMFYWGTQGGEILYWHSSPHQEEYGDWVGDKILADSIVGRNRYSLIELQQHHLEFYESLASLSFVERDEIFKKQAIENSKKYPRKYLKNTLASGLRMYFNTPYSYTPQKLSTFVYIIPNMFIVVFMLLAGLLWVKYWRSMPSEATVILMFLLFYVGGIILLNGRSRHLVLVLPFHLVFMACVFSNLLKIGVNEE